MMELKIVQHLFDDEGEIPEVRLPERNGKIQSSEKKWSISCKKDTRMMSTEKN